MSLSVNGREIFVPRESWRHAPEPQKKFDPLEYAPLVKKAIEDGLITPGVHVVSRGAERPKRIYPKEMATCAVCGGAFERDINRAVRKTCSDACKGEVLRLTRLGDRGGKLKRDYKRQCVVCSKEFDGAFTQTLCSDVCKIKRQKETNKKSKEKQRSRRL